MHFPNVPIDERLFESNELLREYWERSTDNRGVHFAADARFDNDPVLDDVQELRDLSMAGFEQSPVFYTRDALVLPKSEEEPESLVVSSAPMSINNVVVFTIIGVVALYCLVLKSGGNRT